MKRCRFYAIGDNPQQLTFEDCREGYFMRLGVSGDQTMAFVQASDGRIMQTFPEFVKVYVTPMDELMAALMTAMQGRVAASKWAETEKMIVQTFEKYAW